MVVDLMILTDDKDELKRYVPSLVATFEYVNPNITIERKPTSHYNRENVPTACKLLFLLTGNQSRAADMVKRWLKYIYTVRKTNSKHFAVTVDDQHTAVGDESGTMQLSEVSSSINVIRVNDIDLVELWVPQFINTFFHVPRHHGTVYSINNISKEYVLAKETEKHIQNLLTQIGFCKDTYNDIKCTFIVLLSGLKQDQRKVNELQDLTKAATDTSIPVHCVSTRLTSSCSYTDIIESPIYGRPDIVTCVVMTMVSLGLIQRSRTCWSYWIWLCKSFKVYAVKTVRMSIAIIMMTMNLLYGLSVTPFVLFFIGFYNWAFIIRFGRDSNDAIGLYICTNIFATALYLGLLWGVGWPADGHVHYMECVIGTVCIICFYIIWYSCVHWYIFDSKLGYTYGVFDIPYICWEK